MKKKLLGYQVITKGDGPIDIPQDLHSFEIVSKKVAQSYIDAEPEKWQLSEIYEGDIEDPSILPDSNFEL